MYVVQWESQNNVPESFTSPKRQHEMVTSGCSISLSNGRKRCQEKIALVWRVDQDTFGGTQWPTFFHIIRQHIQKNANRVSCAACLELVQVQAQAITSQERNVSLLWMCGGHVALASAA